MKNYFNLKFLMNKDIKNLIIILKSFIIKSRYKRKLILILLDLFIIPFSVYAAFSFYLTNNFNFQDFWILPTSSIAAIVIYSSTSFYKSLTRFTNSLLLYKLAFRNFILIAVLYTLGSFWGWETPSSKVWLLIWIFSTSITALSRLILRDLLNKILSIDSNGKRKKIIIYGAGYAGAQLLSSLRISSNFTILFFIDDSPSLWNMEISGVKIKSPDILVQNNNKIDQIFLAIPSASIAQKKEIISKIKEFNIPLLEVPSIEDISKGKYEINSLQPIKVEDLLGRESVIPDLSLIKNGIKSKSICITGAGGSIGSQLCREIAKHSPEAIILVEINEPSLYSIYEELKLIENKNIKLIPLLEDVASYRGMRKIFNNYKIDIIFHAAAYKHVPLVEINSLSGIRNNILSTYVLCKLVKEFNLEKLILISTDKAVRPTSVMGASKRVAELIIQGYSKFKTENGVNLNPTFSIVRFGNVLGSSGSVVPLFRSQIAKGGPITLTHPDVIRYFMTINEAAQLVIQASGLSQGGEVFLLDMGEPVKIGNLAKQMINLSGLKVKDIENPNGDIEVINIGLRPGEKLYEELLIDKKSLTTQHELIYKGLEDFIPIEDLLPKIEELIKYIENTDENSALNLIKNLVPEWTTSKI